LYVLNTRLQTTLATADVQVLDQSATAPEYLVWTSAKGLSLALSVEYAHGDWPKEVCG
jgi:hypothetical protein